MSDRDNIGALHKNDEKKSERSPDYGGKCVIGGVEYRVSGWIKDGRSGKFLSLAFTPTPQNAHVQNAPRGVPQPASRPAQETDDLPF